MIIRNSSPTEPLTEQLQDKFNNSLFLKYLARLRALNISDKSMFELSAISGDIDIVRHFHQQGLSLRAILPLVIISGHVDLLRYLHQQGTDISAALPLAVISGQVDILRYLHQQGIDLGYALPLAILAGKVDILRYLHHQGIDISQAAVMAAAAGNVGCLRYLHQHNIDISLAPMVATTAGKVEILQYLIEQGIDISNSDTNGNNTTALLLAVIAGQIKTVQYLFELGTDLQNALLLACIIGNVETIHYLYQQGFDIQKALPLIIAAGNIEVLCYFHQHGISIDEALPLASIVNQPKVLRYFFEQGFDIKDSISFVSATGDLESIQFLHQQGCDMQEALLFAVAAGHLNVVEFLSKHGIAHHLILPVAVTTGQVEILKYCLKDAVNVKDVLAWATLARQANIIKFLHENDYIEGVLSPESQSRLQLMTQEILDSDPIYHPSQFWHIVGDAQRAHLRFGGEANFKRTINQSYCNFIPTSLEDPLILHLNKYHSEVDQTAANYTIEDPDNDPNLWFSFYNQYQIFQGDRELKKKLYLQFVSTLYEYALSTDNTDILKTLEEPTLGNPIKLYRDGKLISQDLVTSFTEYNNIIKHFNLTKQNKPLLIGELGAGYGRLAYVFLKTTNCRYMIFDIPPALHISEWYLSTLFPEKSIFKFRHFDNFKEIEEELTNTSIAFFTPNQLSLFPANYFDSFVTISSLHEMSRAQIKHFIKEMSGVTKKLIYTKQYWEYLNSHDSLCITDAEYIFPPTFTVIEKKQDILNPLFFEMSVTRKTTTISVLLSNYNHAQYLPESLSAICEQTVAAEEIIIIDDGSTDNSVEVIEEFKKKYPQITLIRNLENKGLLYSINIALKHANGDYIVWASADDKILPNFIERNTKAIELYPQTALCFSRLAVFEDGTNVTRCYTEDNYGAAFDLGKNIHFLRPQDLLDRLQRSYLWMSGNTVVAKRTALLEMGGFLHNLRWHADWFAFYAIALRYGVCIIPETLAMMRERPNTYSQKGMSDKFAQYRVLSAVADMIYDYDNKDITTSFIKAPCLLSPFGSDMLIALAKKPLCWKLFWQYLNWYLFFHQQYHIRLKNRLSRVFRKLKSKLPLGSGT